MGRGKFEACEAVSSIGKFSIDINVPEFFIFTYILYRELFY